MGERILVLDDEANILDILGQHLESEGYSCTLSESPTEALELIEGNSFSLLLTDLKMPDIHGIDVVREVKKIDSDMAIIVVTALVEVTNAIQAMRAGADDYVLKPFNLSEISLSVARNIEKRDLIIQNRNYQKELEGLVQARTSDLNQTNEQLTETKEYLENLIDSTVDAIITVDLNDRVAFANRGALRMLGYSEEELVGTSWGRVLAGGAEEAAYIRRVVDEDKPLQNYESDLKHKSGGAVPVSMSISMVPDREGGTASIVAICKDITEQKRLELELKEMTIRDSLSGLYNQRYFYDRLESEIERARRQKHPLSLLLIDIDHFKSYNDAHGHLEGDKVLQEVGVVINECTRDHVDAGFRYGGDEFTVILPEAPEPQALQIAERIRVMFEAKRFDLLTMSIGLMTYTEDYSARSFIQFTDSMMYDAKRSGGNRVYVYRADDYGE